MGQQDIIEINGRRYDVNTGVLLGESRIKAVPREAAPARHQGRVVDGFTHAKKASPALTPKPETVARIDAARAAAHRQSSPTAMQPHRPERPQTLMRRVVHKPKASLKPAIKTTVPSEIAARPASEIAHPLEKKVSVTQVNPMRLARAKHIPKSHHIHRFEAKPAPEHHLVAGQAEASAASRRPQQDLVSAPRSYQVSHSKAMAAAARRLDSKRQATQLFESALATATSHTQPAHHRRSSSKRRLVSVVSGVAALLLFGGFIAYLNMPAMELRVASMHAGFHAEMPGYKPDGYALENSIKSTDGKVELTYHAGKASYKITQVASTWNSSTLLDQITEMRGAPTRTIEAQGRTIYIYGDTAQWVNGGIQYKISGNASLSSDQLVSIAASI